MPNGKPGDNPLTDLILHGKHPFPRDIEELLLKIHAQGKVYGRYPLGENWPYSPREFDWEQGMDLDEARDLLAKLLSMLEAGKADEILINPHTGKPFLT